MSRNNRIPTGYRPLSLLNEWTDNYNHNDVAMIALSIRRFGMNNALRIWHTTVMAGNHTFKALRLIQEEGAKPDLDGAFPPQNVLVIDDTWTVQVVDVSHLSEIEARAFAIADNNLARRAVTDNRLLAQYLTEIAAASLTAMEATGFNQDSLDELLLSLGGDGSDQGDKSPSTTPTLADSFIVPPFTVLDARQGYWQERKRSWLALGIESELGRGTQDKTKKGLTFSASAQSPHIYELRNRMREAANGVDPSWTEVITEAQRLGYHVGAQTSIFDPVLCELAYRWFSPPTGTVLDPFAGGSVRGVVAALLGRRYTGIELRAEQVEANRAQLDRFKGDAQPRWITGDSIGLDELIAPDDQFDFVFSCPPYFNLERYSDDERDLSTAKTYRQFLEAYRAIIAASCARLVDDRFACFVVGDVRDKKGFYHNFVSDTITAFQDAGLKLYNEAILVTQAASLAIRVKPQFVKAGKLGKTHQNVLVFVKGDPRKAAEARGEIEVSFPAEEGNADVYGEELTLPED